MTFYQICMTFIIYSFIGWCAEVVFSAANHGTYINRGFLAGPVCPIYGFGMVIFKLLLKPLSDSFLLLFLGSVIIATILELATGFLMDKIFRRKWWDYSNEPLNLKGYICLKFSLLWGVGAVAAVYGADPTIQKMIDKLHGWFMVLIMIIMLLAVAADFVISVMHVLRFNKRINELEDLYVSLRHLADKLGRGMADGTVVLGEEKEMLEGKYRRMSSQFSKKVKQTAVIYGRIIKAFPSLTAAECRNVIERLKDEVKTIRKEESEKYDDE